MVVIDQCCLLTKAPTHAPQQEKYKVFHTRNMRYVAAWTQASRMLMYQTAVKVEFDRGKLYSTAEDPYSELNGSKHCRFELGLS